MFDWEHGIALHPVQGIRALTPPEGDDSWDFSSCSSDLGYILELQRGWTFEIPLGSAKSGFYSRKDGHLRKLNYVWQDNTDASGGEVGDHSPLSRFHSDIGITINFQREPGLGPFQNTELRGPLEVSSDVRPPVQMSWDIGFSLGTAQNIQTSLYIVR